MRVDLKELQQRLGQRLRERREAQGMTRERLEELSGVGAHFIGNIERGEDAPSLKSLLKLANALKVDPGSLLQPPQISLPRVTGKREVQLQRLHRWAVRASSKSLEMLLQMAQVIEKD